MVPIRFIKKSPEYFYKIFLDKNIRAKNYAFLPAVYSTFQANHWGNFLYKFCNIGISEGTLPENYKLS